MSSVHKILGEGSTGGESIRVLSREEFSTGYKSWEEVASQTIETVRGHLGPQGNNLQICVKKNVICCLGGGDIFARIYRQGDGIGDKSVMVVLTKQR